MKSKRILPGPMQVPSVMPRSNKHAVNTDRVANSSFATRFRGA